MSPHRSIFVVLAFAVVAAGCGGKKKAPSPGPLNRGEIELIKPPPTTSVTQRQSLAIRANPTLVKQGPTPLVYFVETGDPIVIVVTDMTTGQNLARVPVGGRTIVRVESRNGVYVGTQHVLPGPLPTSHSYGIYLEADQASIFENQVTRPQTGSSP
jgi:hypothetical protein